MVKSSDIRSGDPNSCRRRTRSGLAAVGGATGCRRSARLSHHYGGAAAHAQGTSKRTRNKKRQLSEKLTTLQTKKENRQRRTSKKYRKRREITNTEEEEEEEINEYRQRRGITVKGRDIPNPFRTFGDTGFPEYVLQEFSKAGFVRPTPIQAQVCPIALKGRDLIGIAVPGSGKKLAYLVPAIAHVLSQPKLSRGDGPIVLVLVPTNSVLNHADPVQQEYTKFCAASNIKALCARPFVDQRSPMKSGVGILIATPVYLAEMLRLGLTNLKRVTYLVLDGVDQMLGVDFEPQLEEIVSQIRPDCQKLFLGATWPKEVDKLARPFVRNACKVEIGSPVLKATYSINQIVDFVNEDQKYSRLVRLLLEDIAGGSRTLIFMDIKRGSESCDQIAAQLCTEGWRAVSVHENKSQEERDQIVSGFQAGEIPIVIAMDAAASDMDSVDVKYVINYDFPGSLDEYVYRIDHSGSAGAKGTAYTFFTAANARFAKALTILLKEAGQKVSPELAALGRDVPRSVSADIPESLCGWLADESKKEIGIGHFYPVYVHCPGIINVANFVVGDVNKQQGLQLHFVRVVEAYTLVSCTPIGKTYLTFEAADANACVVNAYQALVLEWYLRPSPLETILFGQVQPDGTLSAQIDTTQKLEFRVYKIWTESDW